MVSRGQMKERNSSSLIGEMGRSQRVVFFLKRKMLKTWCVDVISLEF
jgi:hypothetical protein